MDMQMRFICMFKDCNLSISDIQTFQIFSGDLLNFDVAWIFTRIETQDSMETGLVFFGSKSVLNLKILYHQFGIVIPDTFRAKNLGLFCFLTDIKDRSTKTVSCTNFADHDFSFWRI